MKCRPPCANFAVHLALSLCCAYGALAATAGTRIDSDRDGLSDEFEQTLLEQFRPTIMISPSDCAARPSSFRAGSSHPEVLSADGTIYGQVFPVSNNHIEIHYYTLWDRDCGRVAHPLDVEHLAALISNETEGGSKAIYWYAGAHEKTVCDISSGAHSAAVGAERHGPKVWSSSGKHALYLTQAMCESGCGADSCDGNVELEHTGPVVNLGEINAPVNGSVWISSSSWALSDKMDTDFSVDVIARLEATPKDIMVTLRGRSALRGTIQVSDSVLDGAATGAQNTETGLDAANDQTSRGLGKATRSTRRSLIRAWEAVFGSKEAPKHPEQ